MDLYSNTVRFVAVAFEVRFRIRRERSPRNQEGMELTETHQLLVYADDDKLLGEDINTLRNSQKP
jgi:hypothetical protein